MARDDGGQTCLINAEDGGCPAAGRCRALTFGALDAGVLVVAEEEALPAEALVAAHHVDAGLLAAAVALRALVQVCKVKVAGSEHGTVARRGDGEPGCRFAIYIANQFCFTSMIPQLEETGML